MTNADAQRVLIALGYNLGKGGPSGKGDDEIWGWLSQTACAAFQRARGLAATGWLEAATIAAPQLAIAEKRPAPAKPAVKLPAFPKPTTRNIEEIIVHCTATPEGRPVSVNTIRGWHIGQGWRDIGYHWVVLLDGAIAPGGRNRRSARMSPAITPARWVSSMLAASGQMGRRRRTPVAPPRRPRCSRSAAR